MTLVQKSVAAADLIAVLRDNLGDFSWREPTLLPQIGVAVLELATSEIPGLLSDDRVLRVPPNRLIVDALPEQGVPGAPPPPRSPWVPRLLSLVGIEPIETNLDISGASGVWACARGAGATVAVLDSGVLRSHPRIDLVDGASFVPGQPSWWTDPHGHGTYVAGILGARAGDPPIGVAPECAMYSVKVINDADETTPEWILKGMVWAAEKEMDVVCMSVVPTYLDDLGTDCDVEVDRASSLIYESGGFLAAAVGNTGLGAYPALRWPARCKRVVGVGAHDESGVRRDISSFGPDDPDQGVELMAPGWKIYTTDNQGGYGTLARTSAACPHVAGAAALIISHEGLSNEEIRKRLRDEATDMTPPAGRDEKTGFGQLNIREAVNPTFLSKLLCFFFPVFRLLKYPYRIRRRKAPWPAQQADPSQIVRRKGSDR